MEKETWKPGNMLYPVPAVMVSCADKVGNSNVITIAWAGTVCSDPAMVSISVRPERYSYDLLRDSGEFVINLVSERLTWACDWCGVRSGRDYDKWAEAKITPEPAETLQFAPAIAEAPVSIECKVREVLELGSHHMFVAEVTAVRVDPSLLDERGKLDLGRARLIAWSHGEYRALGKVLGTFGYSVRKKPAKADASKRKVKGGSTAQPKPVQPKPKGGGRKLAKPMPTGEGRKPAKPMPTKSKSRGVARKPAKSKSKLGF